MQDYKGDIMSKKYKLIENGILDIENNMSIPKDERNRHYRKYLKWVDEGNKPDPIQTTAEKAKAKKEKEKEIKYSIIDLIVKRDTAKAKGYTNIESELEDKIVKLESKLK